MKKLTPFLFGVFVLTLLAGCDRTPDLTKFEGFAQGTTYHITYWLESAIDGKALESEVVKEFADIDKAMSNYRPDSVIEVKVATT